MKKSIIYFLSIIVMGSMLSGCGGSSSSGSSKYAAQEAAAYDEGYGYATDDFYANAIEEPAAEEYFDSEYDTETGGIEKTDNSEITAKNRKIIKTVNITAETEQFDALIENVTKRVEELGGYLENTDISGKSITASSTTMRNANITARIPSKNLNAFINNVEENSNITYKTESAEDVTLNYADTEARIGSLRTEQARLNELIAQAEDIDTLIILEKRLTEVRYEIESYESRLRTMDDKIDYSTVYLVIKEVEKYTPDPVVKRTVGERISEGLSESFKDVCEGMVNLFVAFVVCIPYLIALLIILGIIGIIVFAIVKVIIILAKKSEKKRIAKIAKNPKITAPNGAYQDLNPVVLPEKQSKSRRALKTYAKAPTQEQPADTESK